MRRRLSKICCPGPAAAQGLGALMLPWRDMHCRPHPPVSRPQDATAPDACLVPGALLFPGCDETCRCWALPVATCLLASSTAGLAEIASSQDILMPAPGGAAVLDPCCHRLRLLPLLLLDPALPSLLGPHQDRRHGRALRTAMGGAHAAPQNAAPLPKPHVRANASFLLSLHLQCTNPTYTALLLY